MKNNKMQIDRENYINTIRYECLGDGGFLNKLRAREFSRGQYDSLLKALRAYREEIRGQIWIEREVAHCIYHLDLGLRGAFNSFPRSGGERKLIQYAQLESSELILEIITPEYMAGPIPDELKDSSGTNDGS